MFNCDALQQLKQDMHSSKEIVQGLVRGTSKRFGFATSTKPLSSIFLKQRLLAITNDVPELPDVVVR